MGLVANLAALGFLHQRALLNVRGAFLHVLGDTLSSVGVLVGAGMMWLTGWYVVDPIISVLISVVIVVGALPAGAGRGGRAAGGGARARGHGAGARSSW